jgi:hypothetical protein
MRENKLGPGILGAFRDKSPTNFIVSVRPSTCISAAATGRIFVKFGIRDFTKICQETPDLGKIGRKYRVLYMKIAQESRECIAVLP